MIEMVMGSRIDGGLVHRTENAKGEKKSKVETEGIEIEEGPKPRVAAVRSSGTVVPSSIS